MEKKYHTFTAFYPFYLSQHQNTVCRRLHYIASGIIVLLVVYILWSSQWSLIWLVPVIGYGFAWTGHFFFERNKPATFTYPFYSLLGDWVMFKDILTRKIKF